jgi:hypothetical protein
MERANASDFEDGMTDGFDYQNIELMEEKGQHEAPRSGIGQQQGDNVAGATVDTNNSSSPIYYGRQTGVDL